MNAHSTISLREYTPKSKIILRAVSEEFGVSEKDILSKTRIGYIVEARQAVYFITRTTTGLTCVQIGRLMDREQSTVAQATSRFKKRMRRDKALRTKVKSVLQRIKNPTGYIAGRAGV